MGIFITPPLPELERVPCPTCGGDGFLIAADPMLSTRCPGCFGAQQIDVCPACQMVPVVVQGLEVCGCAVATFPLELKAAA